jgi:hypothetical protein
MKRSNSGRNNMEINKTMAREELLKGIDKERAKHINIKGEKNLWKP